MIPATSMNGYPKTDSVNNNASTTETDVCRVCGTQKSIADFRWDSSRRCGDNRYYRRHTCKQCRGNELKTAGAHLVQRNTKVRNRSTALALLGGRCECCGEGRPEMLTFDHINGDGRKSGAYPRKVVDEIIKMGSPDGKYRILCWNCNTSIGIFGYCPHQGRPPEKGPISGKQNKAEYESQRGRKHKLEFIAEYGGECQICGEDSWEFLVLDHVNGRGEQRRRELSGNGINLYRQLKRQGYPKDGYRLLCWNCNDGLELERRRIRAGFIATTWHKGKYCS